MTQRKSEADLLALDLYQTRSQLQEAGRALHDQAGPLLSAAGIQLQLLRMDQPQTAATVDEVLAMLDQLTESVRALSRKLDPSPAAHLGLERALVQLAEERGLAVSVSYTATSKLPPGPASMVYETILAALDRALAMADAAPVRISVRGAAHRLAVRIVWNGRARWPRGEVATLARRLRPAGVLLEVSTTATSRRASLKRTKESTIVSIRYGTRSTARR